MPKFEPSKVTHVIYCSATVPHQATPYLSLLTQWKFARSIGTLGFLLLFPHSGWNWGLIFFLLILGKKQTKI